MNKKETKARFKALSDHGCCICRGPAEIHHLKGHEFGTGMGLKSSNNYTIPLCLNHHRGIEGFHAMGKISWEARFGSQQSWLTFVDEKVNTRGIGS